MPQELTRGSDFTAGLRMKLVSGGNMMGLEGMGTVGRRWDGGLGANCCRKAATKGKRREISQRHISQPHCKPLHHYKMAASPPHTRGLPDEDEILLTSDVFLTTCGDSHINNPNQ